MAGASHNPRRRGLRLSRFRCFPFDPFMAVSNHQCIVMNPVSVIERVPDAIIVVANNRLPKKVARNDWSALVILYFRSVRTRDQETEPRRFANLRLGLEGDPR